MKKSREPLVALFLSLLVPGLGQIYCGKIIKGAILFLIILSSGVGGMAYILNPETKVSVFCVITIAVSFIVFLYCLFDSYLCAKKYNLARGLKVAIAPRAKRLLIAIIVLVPLLYCLAAKLAARYTYSHLCRIYIMPPNSMEPTIYKGEYLLVDLRAYKNSAPQRGDVVLYRPPGEGGPVYLHRILGLPGESVELKDDKVIINGVKITEAWGLKVRHYNGGKLARRGMKPVVVPPEFYYILGDSAARSRDSRYFGTVPKYCLLGRAYKIIYPFNRSGPLQ